MDTNTNIPTNPEALRFFEERLVEKAARAAVYEDYLVSWNDEFRAAVEAAVAFREAAWFAAHGE